ncbi:MAG: alpha/beta fold hydrolase [Betaproteobacteria bacterium]
MTLVAEGGGKQAAVPAYVAPAWLPGGNAQTIYAALLRQPATPALRRERWDSPDGDFIDVDWLDGDPRQPLLVLFHGLEGSSGSHYARALARALAARGWRGAFPHFRGCSGEINRLPRAYHSGDAAEIAWILARMRALAGAAPLFGVGVSLGGNALLKCLGEQGGAAADLTDAAAAVSAPLDLMGAGDALGRGFNLIYSRMFLATMKKKTLAKLAQFPNMVDRGAMLASGTLRDFDNIVTAPLHGYRDTDDYWTRASAKPGLSDIAVPTLVLNAQNDPFLPARYLPAAAAVSKVVTLELPREGGHVGFASGPYPGHLDWLPQRILAFLSEHD